MTPPLQVLTLMTGVSSGIGKATALAFAKAGNYIALVSPSLENLKEVTSIVWCSGVTATSYPLDLADQKPLHSKTEVRSPLNFTPILFGSTTLVSATSL